MKKEVQVGKVAIVKAGQWGNLLQASGDYDDRVERLEQWLKEARSTDDQPVAEVLVVKTTDEALAWMGGGSGAIIYVSRGMTEEAKKVAAEHHRIRVTLFTGRVPSGEVVFLMEDWISFSVEQVRDVVLRY